MTNITDRFLRIRSITAVVFAVGLLCFVWLFKYPMNSDIPLHAGFAKALADILAGAAGPDYPYVLNLKVSSYGTPEMVLAVFIAAFGFTAGTKVALSIWLLACSLSLYKLLQVLEARPAALPLIAFPIALSYFFHLGFWPFMLGMVVLQFALLHFHGRRRHRLLTLAALRVAVFLCHPIPALTLGLHDIVFFFQKAESENLRRTLGKYASAMLVAWLPALALLVYMASLTTTSGPNLYVYAGLLDQIKGALRPLTVYGNLFEVLVNYIPLIALLLLSLKTPDKGRGWKWLLAGALLISLIGVLIPRTAFIGSWENGARVSLYGTVLLIAAVRCSSRWNPAVYAWVVVLFVYNYSASIAAWKSLEPSFVELAETDALAEVGTLRKFNVTPAQEQEIVPIGLGNNAHVWMWSLGKVPDARTLLIHEWGPVKYIGTGLEPTVGYYYQTTPETQAQIGGDVLFRNDVYLIATPPPSSD